MADLQQVKIPETLAAALSQYGLTPNALSSQPNGWYIADTAFMSTFAAGVANTSTVGSPQVLDALERLDPRIGAFGTDGAWVLALAVRHYLIGTPQAFGAAGANFPGIARGLAALSIRWTPAAGQPAFTQLMESSDVLSWANRRENADMAEDGQAMHYTGFRRLDYPWLIDTAADAHQLVYGGGADLPGATAFGLSVITVYRGAIIGKSVIPARPAMPCRAVTDVGGPKAASRIDAR